MNISMFRQGHFWEVDRAGGSTVVGVFNQLLGNFKADVGLGFLGGTTDMRCQYGIVDAAQWADGWMPVDVAMPDVAKGVKEFRQAVADFGRNPDDVEITLVVMSNPTQDLMKRYRDIGITRANIGVGMENWDKPEIVMPMIEEYSKLVPELAS